MSMTMTAPVQSQTSTQPRTGHGSGGGFRNIVKARTGGNGGGHDFSEARAGASPAAGVDYKHEKPITEHERDMQGEEAKQHLNAHVVDAIKMQAAIIKEGVRTKKAELETQQQQTSNANDKYTLARGQGARIRQNIANTAAQLQGDMIKGQGIQQSNMISQQRNQLSQGLGMQMLEAMNLQLEATTTRNTNTQELMQLQGLSQGQLSGSNRTALRSSMQLGRTNLNLPSSSGFGFNQNGFRRPWSR